MGKAGQEQEEGLRRWMADQGRSGQDAVSIRPSARARVMAVTSGKGGVGKSNVTLNLGIALAMQGERVILLDADLGLANINILLGVEPPYTLADVIEGERRLADILWDGPKGVRIIPGASGISRLAAADTGEILGIIDGFRTFEGMVDWILIDTGAGIAANVMSFVLASDEVLVVTSPEPTALADAYGLIKAIWESPENPTIRLVVNRAQGLDRSERMGRRLIELAEKMLNVEVKWAGLIQDDVRVPQAISRQTPFVLAYPATIASRDVEALAKRLMEAKDMVAVSVEGSLEGFLGRLRMAFSRLIEPGGGDQ